MKQIIKKELKFIGRKAFGASIGALVFIVVAGTGIWALAAFTEPSTTPGNSVQDFAKNIMGANNSDNAFDSGDVVANSDGSIVERLESLEAQVGATALSAESGSTMNHAQAAIYCRNLSATAEYVINGSNTSIIYTDWRLGSMTELANFEGITVSTNYIWSATIRVSAAYGYWTIMRLSDGHWLHEYFDYTNYYAGCVR